MSASTFFVAGIPQPQGSKTGYVVGGRAVLADQNRARLKPWRAQVTETAAERWGRERLEGAVRLTVTFVLPRPKSVKRKHPHVKPDGDKLLRALCDGISDAKVVWRDDAQVVQYIVEKVYGDQPGAHVSVEQVA